MGDLFKALEDKKNEIDAWVKSQPPAVRQRGPHWHTPQRRFPAPISCVFSAWNIPKTPKWLAWRHSALVAKKSSLLFSRRRLTPLATLFTHPPLSRSSSSQTEVSFAGLMGGIQGARRPHSRLHRSRGRLSRSASTRDLGPPPTHPPPTLTKFYPTICRCRCTSFFFVFFFCWRSSPVRAFGFLALAPVCFVWSPPSIHKTNQGEDGTYAVNGERTTSVDASRVCLIARQPVFLPSLRLIHMSLGVINS